MLTGLRALIWKTRTERQLDEELRSYLEMATDRKLASGIPRAAAARAARAEMGGVEAIKEHVQDVGWETHLEAVVLDLRFGVRSLLATRRVAIPAVVTLALGIGATTAVFSVMRAVLLEPLPYRDPERIVAVWEKTRSRASRNAIAPANFVAWQERAKTLEHLAMVGPRSAAMIVNREPHQVAGLSATAGVFRTLGVAPALGRPYTDEDDGADAVIVLSHEFWQRVLGGRAEVLDLTLTVDGQPRAVVGVMRRALRSPARPRTSSCPTA